MENEKRTVDSIENQRFFLITVCYENYLKNDVKLEKIFLIDYFQNDNKLRFFIFYGGKVKLPAFFNTQKAQLPL
ncbi:hypothetical protein QLG38_08525 [Staphylococcus aureus]|uniref:hypothetical protein n=1 Tax=Staphylococcus aureus TaxID=1280 RepID=UPI00236868A6|nr:hypothetical protein [Staphylococcus aureus]MDT3035089.1 hypothetical protein [Staphylococcus aureus]MDT3053752.1 hypothetical protein [Staphylococcus aureus]MDT3083052.1 hypothetical protein [Staphylococcus aureus]MDT3258739.1 hypothetical protein [Staphylococcus aureus]